MAKAYKVLEIDRYKARRDKEGGNDYMYSPDEKSVAYALRKSGYNGALATEALLNHFSNEGWELATLAHAIGEHTTAEGKQKVEIYTLVLWRDNR